MRDYDRQLRHDDKHKKFEALVASGGDIAGAAIGGALGAFAAGPGGAAAGSALGAVAAGVLKKIGTDVADRVLGPRERVRVGASIAIAAEIIRGRTQRGDRLRDDGFFDALPNGRSDADEVCEGVLLKTQKEPEEKKVPLMAYLLGNIAFDKNISAHLAHQMIKAAEGMTYRQLCLMKLISVKQSHDLRASDFRGQDTFERKVYEVLYECYDLSVRGFINFGGEIAFGPTDVFPSRMEIQGIGVDMFNQMGLVTIPTSDVLPLASVLSNPR